MKPRVAINGFGRIGRSILRLAANSGAFEVVAINDLVPPDNLAYLLKYDSTHGRFGKKVDHKTDSIIIEGHEIKVCAETDPAKLPWKKLNIDYVIEATGRFTQLEDAHKHIEAGAKRVVISAPGKGGVPTYVMGVNHEKYDPNKEFVVCNASCTTNCLAPLTKILLDNFGIEEGLMTTVHSVTASQPTVDCPSKKDFRGGRAASLNIIPASTGAAKAVALCIPEIQGKLTGMAFRVPTADVSAVDLTVKLTKSTDYDTICHVVKEASMTTMKGIMGYTEDQVVSTDFLGSTYSSIFDKGAGIALNPNFFKLISWYDNEIGYSQRVIDLILYMASVE
ncbi:MAG: type I glyceraldehyde-3-phosphate dehydrogenase [Candidatus Algichlamydia australiensis]|nr:type I glyceraldehyde-3-phosphate dehydrogenase [Chlamydiales bacterium]